MADDESSARSKKDKKEKKEKKEEKKQHKRSGSLVGRALTRVRSDIKELAAAGKEIVSNPRESVKEVMGKDDKAAPLPSPPPPPPPEPAPAPTPAPHATVVYQPASPYRHSATIPTPVLARQDSKSRLGDLAKSTSDATSPKGNSPKSSPGASFIAPAQSSSSSSSPVIRPASVAIPPNATATATATASSSASSSPSSSSSGDEKYSRYKVGQRYQAPKDLASVTPENHPGNYDHQLKFILIGASGVGKTSILNCLRDPGKFIAEHKATIGVEFYMYRYETFEDNKIVQATIWDTAGQERFHAITTSYYRGAHGIVMVYDVTEEKSFGYLNTVCLKELAAVFGDEPAKWPRILVIGNKTDLQKRKVLPGTAESWCAANNFSYFEVSAKTGFRVERAMQEFIEELYALVLNPKVGARRRGSLVRRESPDETRRMTSAPNTMPSTGAPPFALPKSVPVQDTSHPSPDPPPPMSPTVENTRKTSAPTSPKKETSQVQQQQQQQQQQDTQKPDPARETVDLSAPRVPASQNSNNNKSSCAC